MEREPERSVAEQVESGAAGHEDPAAQGVGSCRACPLRRPIVVLCAMLLLVGLALVLLAYRHNERLVERTRVGPLRRPYVDAPFVTTPHDIVAEMLELAQIGPEDVLYDLGCGDGRIVIAAAEKYGCRAWGFDNDPQRVRQSRENVKAHGVEHLVTIHQRDIFTLDLRPADVVTLYLLPRLNVRLLPQLEQLKPGSRIVSHDWDIAGVKPQKQLTLMSTEDHREHTLYLFVSPLEPVEPETPPGHTRNGARLETPRTSASQSRAPGA
ncbi:MAG TPA: methyltransferase domain-containing protein [Planctomycetaceae bacterium]|nr:methyltransferase domain-containing protein [Planctomycetaceae bacterium]